MWVNVLASLNASNYLIATFRGGTDQAQGDGPVKSEASAAITHDFGREFRYSVKTPAFTTEASDVVDGNSNGIFKLAFHISEYKSGKESK